MDVKVMGSHVELVDVEGNTILISTTGNAVDLDIFPDGGVPNQETFDISDLQVSPDSETALSQMLSAISIQPSGPGGGGPGVGIVQGAAPLNQEHCSVQDPLEGSVSGFGCFGAGVGLAAAAAAVYISCGGAQAVLACAAALGNYLSASINYWSECGYLDEH